MWRILGKVAHLWPTNFYRLISKIHSKIIKFNHTKAGEYILGDHILLLETIGNKSQKLRKTPLTYAEHKNSYIVAASFSGNDNTPDWYFNLFTSPPYITVNDSRFEVVVEEIQLENKEFYWSLLDEVYPTFKTYRQRTDRDIPLIRFIKA